MAAKSRGAPARSRRMALALSAAAAAAALFFACTSPALGPPGPRPEGVGDHTPFVYVPGVTGTKLRDASTGEMVWGNPRQLTRPRDEGRRLAMPLAAVSAGQHSQWLYETPEPLWEMPLLPGFTKMIYRPLLEYFERSGYRLGRLEAPAAGADLFFFNYDWRRENLESVQRLDRQLEALSAARGGIDVDLVCQSNAAKICRWLAKYGTLDPDAVEAGEVWQRGYRIRKLVLVGASNDGALRVLQLLLQGRSYVPLIGRKFRPETFFTIRPLYGDLPADRQDLFFDERGRILDVDLFDAGNWPKYGWSIFGAAARERLARQPRPDLFGDRTLQLEFLAEQLQTARRMQLLLARDSDQFPEVEYYRLENESSPTIDRALLTRESGDWKTYFLGDGRVNRDPVLKKLASAPGDGHATLASQRGLSPQERAALVESRLVTGGHFEAVILPAGLDAIRAFLER